MRTSLRWLSGATLVVLVAVAASATPAAAVSSAPAVLGPPTALSVSVQGANGVGTTTSPGLACAQGGTGSYRHYLLQAPLAGGVFGQQSATVRANVEIHRDGPASAGAGPGFVLATESHVTLSNARGTLRMTMDGGSCAGGGPNTATFTDPTHVSAAGSLSGAVGRGAYRGATVTGGTYTLGAEVAPGADNSWLLGVGGSVRVLQPSLHMAVDATYWGNLGLDYLTRVVTVRYKVTNVGEGDAFGVSLTSTSSPTAGVSPLGPVPQPLGDLAAGEAELVTVRYKLGLTGPCALVILACNFSTVLGASVPDALDVATPGAATVAVTAPILPPPL